MANKKDPENRVLCKNAKARHDYQIDENFEAGVVLTGSEVKSIRAGQAVLLDAYAEVRRGELVLCNANVAVYPFAHGRNHEPVHDRKLLVHKREITRLASKIREKGYTIIPLSFYLKAGKIKVDLGLAKGKRQYDKRVVEREKTHQRDLRRGED